MSNEPRGIERERDGYFHPSSVEEVQALVAHATSTGTPLRVRGSGHSPDRAIFGDRFNGRGAPPKDSVEVAMNRLEKVTFLEEHEDHAIVEVEAGCHLGRDPHDFTGTSRWATSLNVQLDERGYAFDGLGGISHQTVSGFMLTGSSGGSVSLTGGGNIIGIQFVDGRGEVQEASAGDDLFAAAGVSMGLFGVITKVRLRVVPRYDVVGRELSVELDDSIVDLFGEGSTGKPSFEEYMRSRPYSRMLWWPQNNVHRLQFWEAERVAKGAPFERKPFQILTPTEAALGSLAMTMVGHIHDLSRLPTVLREVGWYDRFREALDRPVEEDINAYGGPSQGQADRGEVYRGLEKVMARAMGQTTTGVALTEPGPLPTFVAKALAAFMRSVLEGHVPGWAGKLLTRFLEPRLPSLIDEIVKVFISLEEKTFADRWFTGLPMDNQMDDLLWPTEFSEMWMPIEKTPEICRTLRDHWTTGSLA
ncbi:MAG: FAD-binding protein, partial [Myxococcales bacterium]|nr:FAD-binding protein [Myxococcales bacterium]